MEREEEKQISHQSLKAGPGPGCIAHLETSLNFEYQIKFLSVKHILCDVKNLSLESILKANSLKYLQYLSHFTNRNDVLKACFVFRNQNNFVGRYGV